MYSPSTSKLLELIKDSKFIFIHRKEERFSGAIALALSFHVPMIMDSAQASVYDFPRFEYSKNVSELAPVINNITDYEYKSFLDSLSQYVSEKRKYNWENVDQLLGLGSTAILSTASVRGKHGVYDKNSMTFVLVTHGKDIEYAFNLTIYSINRLFILSSPIIIVVPTKDIEKTKYLSTDIENITIVDENTILPAWARNKPGYQKQMLIKLFVSRICKTPLYMTLDSDMYLVKKTQMSDFFCNGLPKAELESRDAHSGWWNASEHTLGIKFEDKEGFGVTPAIMYRDICLQLLSQHEKSIETSTKDLEAGNSFYTEYTLYWIFLCKHWNYRELYCLKPLYSNGIWSVDMISEDAIKKQFTSPDAPFSLFQSNTGQLDKFVENIRQQIQRVFVKSQDKLPTCYTGGGETEWGERDIARKHTKPFHRILELGGGAGSVSAIIQAKLAEPSRHVVVQPVEEKAMMGGFKQLMKNKKACNFKFTAIDHFLTPADVQPIIEILGGKPNCLVVDCENCLVGEYEKNPELFDEVEMIQVERDDFDGSYTKLFDKLGFVKTGQGYGCDGECPTEVWEKPN